MIPTPPRIETIVNSNKVATRAFQRVAPRAVEQEKEKKREKRKEGSKTKPVCSVENSRGKGRNTQTHTKESGWDEGIPVINPDDGTGTTDGEEKVPRETVLH
jgi:hypothetical protein